jgi:hypothetical protein
LPRVAPGGRINCLITNQTGVRMTFSPRVAAEIARLMRDPNALRDEPERMPSSGRRGHYDPNQPRVSAGNSDGGQWTDTDGYTAASGLNDNEHPQLAQFSPDRAQVQTPVRPPIRHPGGPGLIGTLLTLFAIWSARNTPERRAVFEFNAREYLKGSNDELVEANVDRLNREEVKNACPGIDEVQARTNKAYSDVMLNGGWFMSPQQLGTAVHKQLERSIKDDATSKLQAEVSRVKSEDANKNYGTRDSVRIDVLECPETRTTYVYDIKTGESRSSGLSPRRMRELASYAFNACPGAERVIVTEVRPGQ